MERTLLFREISNLEDSLWKKINHEASFADKIILFFKQTSYDFPVKFVQLLLSNEKRENFLTDRLFFERHPERKNRKLTRNEKKLIREWLSIRKDVVRPILQYLYGKRSDVTKIESKELFADILRFIESWIDAYLVALDNFKYVTEKSTEAELNELKGISGKFLFEITREAVDIIVDFAGDVPILGQILKTVKAAGSIAHLINRYKERQAQYQSLKNKNDLVDFVVSEKELFSNIKIELNRQYRDLAELFVPMMSKDKFIRARFENIYRRSKKFSYTNQSKLFKQVCEKWAQQFPNYYLRIVFNRMLKIISLKFEGVPFGEQILSKLKSSADGLNLEAFRVNRRIIFYPLSLTEPAGAIARGIDLRFEFTKDANGNARGFGPVGSPHLHNRDSYNKAQKLFLAPLPIVK